MERSLTKQLDVIYDGLCLFCIRTLAVIRVLDRQHALAFHDANDRAAVLSRFDVLRDADLDAAMYVVDRDGRAHAGFHAFRRIARSLPLLWPVVPLLYLPGIGRLGEHTYDLVARNRRRLGCRVV